MEDWALIDRSVLLQFLFSGITLGSVYALIAISLVIVYNVSRVLCFAQGEFFVFGALTMIALTALGIPMSIGFFPNGRIGSRTERPISRRTGDSA